jgi:hypothetical protein
MYENMKKAFYLSMVVILILFSYNIATESTIGQPLEAPAWDTYDIWIYNLTIEGNPNPNYMTTIVTGKGSIQDYNGTMHLAFDVYRHQEILEDSPEYGHMSILIGDARRVTRDNYSLAFSKETTIMKYEYGHENYTVEKIIKYDPFVNFYSFPIESGEKWNQTVNQNVSITVVNSTSTSSNMYNETKTFYCHCTGTEEVSIMLADYDGYLLENASANWSQIAFKAHRIVQDDEETDTDGAFVVEYHSDGVGNIVKREVFTEGALNSTALLAYYEYAAAETVEDDTHEQDKGWLDSLKDILWVILIIILIIMIGVLVFIKKRRKNGE